VQDTDRAIGDAQKRASRTARKWPKGAGAALSAPFTASVLKCPPHAVAPSRPPRCAPISVVLHVSASDAVAHLRACRVLSVPLSPLRSIAAPANRYALLALDDAVSCETRMRHSLRCHRVALACPRVVRPCTRPTMRPATGSPAECSSKTLRGVCKARVCACHTAVGCSAAAGGAAHYVDSQGGEYFPARLADTHKRARTHSPPDDTTCTHSHAHPSPPCLSLPLPRARQHACARTFLRCSGAGF
jgi:hypothetical protein